MIEHFHSWEAPGILQDWRRVLKPGGKLILELPCMDKVFRFIAMATQGIPVPMGFTFGALWGGQEYKRPAMCHKWGYTAAMLADVVGGAGFRDIRITDSRYHFPERDMRLEAVK